MNEEDIKLLEENGWIVVCEIPFEIENEEGTCGASGEAAEIVLNSFKK